MKSIWILLVCALQFAAGAKILSIITAPSRSHHNVIERLVVELAKRGHEVTFVTPFKQPKPIPNLREVIIPYMHQEMRKIMMPPGEEDPWKKTHWAMPFMPIKVAPVYTDIFLSTLELQKLIKSEDKYDVVLAEPAYAENLIAGFAYKHKAAIVAVAVFNMLTPNYYADYLVGDPSPTSYIPDSILRFSSRMSFCERLENTLFWLLSETTHRLFYIPKMDAVMRKHFGSDLPPLDDIIKNTSLVLVNNHFSLGYPRPHLPNVVEIGSYHIYPPEPLPTELQKFLDESKQGAVYFSMGSHIQSAGFPKETKEGILKAFSRLKQNVLWKFEDDSLTNLPKNVKIIKWAPQSDILAHPNVKLFITHGGKLSTTEAVTRGVPIVGIPVGGDQLGNMKLATSLGYGVTLQLNDINEENLYKAVVEVLDNPKYRKSVKIGSTLINDTPLSSIDTAMYWIEYVVRHKGAPHLRSAAQDLKWYELHLLDVLGTIFIVILLVIFISIRLIKFTVGKISGLFSKKVSKQKKRN